MPYIRQGRTTSSGGKRKRAEFVPRTPKNPIFRAVSTYLNEIRRHDFHLGVRITGVSVYAKVKKDGKLSRITFAQRNTTPIRMFARCLRAPAGSSPKINAEDIQVRGCLPSRWASLALWLQETYGGLVGLDYTFENWSKRNGSKFRFLDLPPELRTCIYGHIAPAYIWPHGRHRDGMLSYACDFDGLAPPFGSLFYRDASGNKAPRSLPFACTNRQIAKEFAHHVRTHTTSHFLFRIHFGQVITYFRPADCLRRISLGFPNWMYFRFLGYDGHGGEPFAPCTDEGPYISVLSSIDTLEHLNFHFQIAQNKEYGMWPVASWDPWTTPDYDDRLHVSCQKIFVSWFFTFALAYIRHVPNITFTGHVKKSTRRYWEAIFRVERAGRRCDMTERIAYVLSLPHSIFPPPCFCENPCTYWNIQGPHNRGYEKPQYDPHQLGYNPLEHDPFLYDG